MPTLPRRPILAAGAPVFVAGLLGAAELPAAPPQVVLNEWVASNVDGLRDEDGDTPDWIELRNLSPTPVDLSGWSLSDDPAGLDRWQLPAVTIPGDGYQLVLASGKDRQDFANEWLVVVSAGDTGRYFEGLSDPPGPWADVDYDDASWPQGPSGFGRGDGDDATPIAADSVFVRMEFTLTAAQLAQAVDVVVHVDYDDAFVAFLNGEEVARANISVPGVPVSHHELAYSEHEAELYRGRKLDPFPVRNGPLLLREGKNVLALQAHNHLVADDDLSLIPFLSIGRMGVGTGAHPQLWFPPPRTHADFKLDAYGETLTLFDDVGSLVDQVQTGRLFVDTSRGRPAVGGGALLSYATPTPDAANTTAGVVQALSPPTISPAGGVLSAPVTVSIQHPSPTAEIRVSLDGSEPTPGSQLYQGPITLQAGGPTIVRARAFEVGVVPSRTVTQSYIPDQGRTLPIFSLVTDPDNLWDDEIGIHVLGNDHDPNPPFWGANYWQPWERPMHVEFFETDGRTVLHTDAGVRIHGGRSRIFEQKTFRLVARAGYEDDRFEHAFFGPEGPDEFKRFLLRNAGNDFAEAHCRDGIVSTIAKDIEADGMLYRPALVYLNGEPWGIMNIRERIDEDYLAAHHDVDPDEVDLLENSARPLAGDAVAWNDLLAFLAANDLAIETNYRYVETQIDLPEYWNYLAVNLFFANTDWPNHNVKYWRSREPGGKWRWVLFDLDYALGREVGPDHNTLAWALGRNGAIAGWATFVLEKLARSPFFVQDFTNAYADHLNTRFQSANTIAEAMDVALVIQPEIRDHMRRFGETYGKWRHNGNVILDFLSQRLPHARQHVQTEFGFTGTYTLNLDVDPPGSGSIQLTAISVDEPFSGEYYLGNPVKLTAVPGPGFQFKEWSDVQLGTTSGVEIDPAGNHSLVAFFEPGGPSLVINEINYKSPAGFDPDDWVELHNDTDVAIDLGGWQFRDEGNAYTFPPVTIVPPRGYLVLAEDLQQFQALWPGVPVVGSLGFGLRSSGERVELVTPQGAVFDTVTFGSAPPWPTTPNGQGPTLELQRPELDNADPLNWSASTVLHGTPGAKNSVTP